MRKHQYRGQRVDTKEWVYGNYVYDSGIDRHFITMSLTNSHKLIQVIPETVGEFTGLPDKNGQEIYEDDKLRNVYEEEVIVSFDEGKFIGVGDDIELGLLELNLYFEVVGNIHNNPELLK